MEMEKYVPRPPVNVAYRRLQPPRHSYTYMREKVRAKRCGRSVPEDMGQNGVRQLCPEPHMGPPAPAFHNFRLPPFHHPPFWGPRVPFPMHIAVPCPIIPPPIMHNNHAMPNDKQIEMDLRRFIQNMNAMQQRTNQGNETARREFSRICAEQTIKAALGLPNETPSPQPANVLN